jgi:hypothetical protein
MSASAWPSDRSFKPDGAKELLVNTVPEPKLGKVFQFDPIVHRHPRPLPQVPELDGGPIPTDPLTRYAQQVPMRSSSSGDEITPVSPAAPPAPPKKPPLVATAAPAPDEPQERVVISAERLAFLERVEALVGAESRISDLESENRHLISIVSRLQRQVEESKKGAEKA